MTYRYSEMNQHDALYLTARKYPGGVEALAQRLGMSPNVLYKKLRPAVETHSTNFEEVSQIVEAAVDARMPEAFAALHAFNWRHGFVAVQLPTGPVCSDVLLAQVVRIMGEEGQLASDVSSALADRRVSAQERERIEQDIECCIQSLVALRDLVRVRQAADAAEVRCAHVA